LELELGLEHGVRSFRCTAVLRSSCRSGRAVSRSGGGSSGSVMEDAESKAEVELRLLRILCTEIYRDGGSSLVRDLKEYNPLIGRLLKRSKTSKFLALLESHPELFDVERDRLPHVVCLTSDALASTNDVPSDEVAASELCLKERVVRTIRKEITRNGRRKRGLDNGVNLTWLIPQCKRQLHQCLRLSGAYRTTYASSADVKFVGSSEWTDAVTSQFVSVTRGYCNVSADGRVTLHDDALPLDIGRLATRIVEAVEDDGGTHISLSLLLHRNEDIQTLLSGHDLLDIKSKNESLFESIEISTRGNHVILRSRQPKRGRMEVDETGMFSVTASRWGNLFAAMMASHCRSVLKSEPNEVICIDLTASVGGMALPMTKQFKRVIAVEIDSHRAELCRRNMENHEVSERVEVFNQDSVEYLPELAKQVSTCPRVVLIDPPWGGKHHKSDKVPITMGKWTMADVIKRVSLHLTPALVGLRMPVYFDVESLTEELMQNGVKSEQVQIRKAGPQIFIILRI